MDQFFFFFKLKLNYFRIIAKTSKHQEVGISLPPYTFDYLYKIQAALYMLAWQHCLLECQKFFPSGSFFAQTPVSTSLSVSFSFSRYP